MAAWDAPRVPPASRSRGCSAARRAPPSRPTRASCRSPPTRSPRRRARRSLTGTARSRSSSAPATWPLISRRWRALRAIVGDDAAVMGDYNQSLTRADARERLRRLDGDGLAWIEEPIAADDIDGYAAARARDGHADPSRRELVEPARGGAQHRRRRLGPRDARRRPHRRGHRLATGSGARRDRRPADLLAPLPRGQPAPARRHPGRAPARAPRPRPPDPPRARGGARRPRRHPGGSPGTASHGTRTQ